MCGMPLVAAFWNRKKYRANSGHQHGMASYTFIPASVEAYGYLGKSIVGYLRALSDGPAALWVSPMVSSCFLSACPRSVCAAVCSVIACYALWVGVSVAAAAVPAGDSAFAAGMVCSCLRSLSLPPSSSVARRCPAPTSAPQGLLRPRPSWGEAWSPSCFFCWCVRELRVVLVCSQGFVDGASSSLLARASGSNALEDPDNPFFD
jgi:hypothetical protein